MIPVISLIYTKVICMHQKLVWFKQNFFINTIIEFLLAGLINCLIWLTLKLKVSFCRVSLKIIQKQKLIHPTKRSVKIRVSHGLQMTRKHSLVTHAKGVWSCINMVVITAFIAAWERKVHKLLNGFYIYRLLCNKQMPSYTLWVFLAY